MKPAELEKNRLCISLAELKPLAESAARSGTCVPDALAVAGLEPDILLRPDTTPIKLSAYFRFSEYAGQTIQDETLGVSRRTLLPGSTRFVLSHLPKHSTLLDAMREIAEAYNFLHGGNFNHVEVTKDRLSYIIDDKNFPYMSGTGESFRYFTMECVMIFLHSILVLIASDTLDSKLLKLHLRRARNSGGRSHLDFWDVPFRFNSGKYALIYNLSAAQLPIKITPQSMPSRGGFGKVADLIERREAYLIGQERIHRRVCEILESGVKSQQDVAKMLGFSVASLRRRLDEEGASFRDLYKSKMNDQAKLLLRRGLSIQEVAENLGFSDFRSFTRAFKNWNDATPNAYLSSLRAGISKI